MSTFCPTCCQNQVLCPAVITRSLDRRSFYRLIMTDKPLCLVNEILINPIGRLCEDNDSDLSLQFHRQQRMRNRGGKRQFVILASYYVKKMYNYFNQICLNDQRKCLWTHISSTVFILRNKLITYFKIIDIPTQCMQILFVAIFDAVTANISAIILITSTTLPCGPRLENYKRIIILKGIIYK